MHAKLYIPQSVEIELIFAIRAAVSEIRADLLNCHIWPLNLAIDKGSRSCTYTLFLPQVSKLGLFSLYRQRIPRYEQPDFQNYRIWAWNLASTKTSRSCTYTLFFPWGVEIELIFALRAAISEIQAIFQNCHTGHETWLLAKVAHIIYSLPQEVEVQQQAAVIKIRLFSH